MQHRLSARIGVVVTERVPLRDEPKMTEDELLTGISQALELGGWTWTHLIRSDGVTQGSPGLPDIVACRDGRFLMWELKTASGQLTADQLRWQLEAGTVYGVDARVIRPVDYDAALEVILRHKSPALVWPS